MSVISILVNGATVGATVYDLYKIYKNSPIAKSEKSKIIDVVRDSTSKRISSINLSNSVVTSIGAVNTAFELYSQNKRDNSKIVELVESKSVSIPVISVKSNLIDSINLSNDLKKTELDLLSLKVQNLELMNQLKEAELNQRNEHMISFMMVLHDIATELKINNDIIREVGASSSDDMSVYFSELASFFKFQNTGIFNEKENYFGETTFSKMVDSEGNEIIPAQTKAKSDAEKFIKDRDSNIMDFAGVDVLLDDDENDNLMSSILNNILNYGTNSDVAGSPLVEGVES